jgi:hypothetical protein
LIAELEYKKSKIKALLTKIDSKAKNFKSEEDVKKFFHILFEDLSNLKSEKNKN